MVPTVYVAEPIHVDALDLLAQHTNLTLGFGPSAQPIDAVLADISGIIWRSGSLDWKIISAANNLRVIARHGVGFDNVDVTAATQRNIAVLITPEANYRAVAEHVFALLLATRRHVLLGDRMVRDGRFADRDSLAGNELRGSTLGIIGMGRIGAEVARIAKTGFDMRVLVHDPWLDAIDIAAAGMEPEGRLLALLERSDAVTVHVPLTAETHDLLGAGELARMPRHAVLINTARGGIVNEHALAIALREGSIAGAGIDVFGAEPPAPDNPLLSSRRTVLSPHSGALTHEALRQIALDAARGVLDVLHGTDPRHPRSGWKAVNAALLDGRGGTRS